MTDKRIEVVSSAARFAKIAFADAEMAEKLTEGEWRRRHLRKEKSEDEQG